MLRAAAAGTAAGTRLALAADLLPCFLDFPVGWPLGVAATEAAVAEGARGGGGGIKEEAVAATVTIAAEAAGPAGPLRCFVVSSASGTSPCPTSGHPARWLPSVCCLRRALRSSAAAAVTPGSAASTAAAVLSCAAEAEEGLGLCRSLAAGAAPFAGSSRLLSCCCWYCWGCCCRAVAATGANRRCFLPSSSSPSSLFDDEAAAGPDPEAAAAGPVPASPMEEGRAERASGMSEAGSGAAAVLPLVTFRMPVGAATLPGTSLPLRGVAPAAAAWAGPPAAAWATGLLRPAAALLLCFIAPRIPDAGGQGWSRTGPTAWSSGAGTAWVCCCCCC